MNLNLTNKVAVITGASRGIGAAIARALITEEVKVFNVSRTPPPESELSREIFSNEDCYQFVPADLSNKKGVNECLGYFLDNQIHADIVVNNVGGNLGITDPLASVEAWQSVMQFNLFNSIAFNNYFLPEMQRRKWGRVCHISSIASLENQGTPMYCAAKAALNAYVRSVGRYVSKDNVILTAVLPGAIFTSDGYWDRAQQERPEHVQKYLAERMAINRFGTVDEISDFVAFLVSDKASFAVGSSILLDGGQGRVFYEG